MAISPKLRYPEQIDETDLAGYPHGKAQNVAVEGDGTGTPLEKDIVNDVFGFQQAILAAAAVAPSGVPDKVGASQYLSALPKALGLLGGLFVPTTPIQIGGAGLQIVNAPFTASGTSQFNGMLYVSSQLRLSTQSGTDSNMTITVGGTGQIIHVHQDTLSNNRVYSLSETNAQSGNFFILLNDSFAFSITVNSDDDVPLTVMPAESARLFFYHSSRWRSLRLWN